MLFGRISLLLMFLIFKFTSAYLKSCMENNTKHLDVCFTNKNGYLDPFPVTIKTDLFMNKFVDIHPNKNTITIQMSLWLYWIDPGLSLTNNLTK